MGKFLKRFPVALKIALAIAAAEPIIPTSPKPFAPLALRLKSGLLIKSTSMIGTSAFTAKKTSVTSHLKPGFIAWSLSS